MIEPYVPELFVIFVDGNRWPRRIELVELVASRSLFGQPALIGRRLLRELGRTPSDAKNDHRAMIGLHRDGVLVRWPAPGGPYPDAWLVSPDVGHWRNVPWKNPPGQRAAATWLDHAARQGGKSAGQSARQGGNGPPWGAPNPLRTTLNGYPPDARGYPPDARPTRENTPPGTPLTRGPAPGLSIPSNSVIGNYVSLSLEEGREGGTKKQQPPDLAPVIGRLQRAIDSAVTGRAADQLGALVATHGAPAVIGAIPKVDRYRSAIHAVEALAALLAPVTPAPAHQYRCERCHDQGLVIVDDCLTDEVCSCDGL